MLIGKHHTEETKQKISNSKKGMIPWNKGLKLKPLSEEHKNKISKSETGTHKPPFTKEHIRKLSLAKKGKPSNTLGKHWKISKEGLKNHKGYKKGENHFNWIKDRTKLAKSQERNDSAYREWRYQVFKRDRHICIINNEDCFGKVVAHHILPWRDFPKLRYLINNGITLCQAHHPRVRAEEKRLIPTFQELVSVLKESI